MIRAKAGAEILAVHQDMSNASGRLPLLVTRPFGAGKVLFMGTDGAWRWRKGVEDKYHYRFWGQVVRWMAYQRNMAKGESMRLFYNPDQPAIRQTISLNAHVMDTSGEPLQDGEVIASITSPSGGRNGQVSQRAIGGKCFAADSMRKNLGSTKWSLLVRNPMQSWKPLSLSKATSTNLLGNQLDLKSLEEISRITRGKMLTLRRWIYS